MTIRTTAEQQIIDNSVLESKNDRAVFSFEEIAATPSLKDAIGSKAKSLIELTEFGFLVPKGVVILGNAFDELLRSLSVSVDMDSLMSEFVGSREVPSRLQSLRKTIQSGPLDESLLSELERHINRDQDIRWAVRSSGNLEDLQNQSFAGLYETFLNCVGIQSVSDAVRACWASVFDERVLAYLRKHQFSLKDISMSVILQPMVDAEKSGVAFSVNPLATNDHELLIEACNGLGDQLVNGQVNPHRQMFHWLTKERITSSGESVLTDQESQMLCHEVIRVQAAFGFPVDVEWAIQGGKLFLLQSRPITHFNFARYDKAWTTADLKDGGVSSTVCTPLMWSLYQLVWDHCVPDFLNSVGLLNEKERQIQWSHVFYGRLYWNLSDVKRLYGLLPGYVERRFDEDIGIEPVYEGDGVITPTNLNSLWHAIRLIWRYKKNLKIRFQSMEGFKATVLEKFSHFQSLLEESPETLLSEDNIGKWLEQFIREDYFSNEKNYFLHIFNVSISNSMFGDAFNKVATSVQLVDLVSALGNLSHLKLNVAIWDYSRAILKDSGLLNYWQSHTSDEIVAAYTLNRSTPSGFHALVQTFKHHSSRELDISVANYDEDPIWLVQSIKHALLQGEQHNPHHLNQLAREQFLAHQQQYLKDVPWWKKNRAARQLEEVRALLWWREEFRDLSTQYYYWMRRIVLLVGEHLVKKQILTSVNEVFFLPQDTLIRCVKQQLSAAEAQRIVEMNKLYYQGFRHFQNPNELGNGDPMTKLKAAEGDLHGVGCSPGCVTGTIRVVRDIFDSDRIQEGDILITRFTDPGWTPKFALIKGIATETGGVLSHAAVISREYGIPAVLAVSGLTSRLRDGQTIMLDGNTGLIKVLD